MNSLGLPIAPLRDALSGFLSHQPEVHRVQRPRFAPTAMASGHLEPAVGFALQMLAEPLPWNWAVPALGMTPAEAYGFFDFMPASLHGPTYVPSSQSFSKNYVGFLNLLNPEAVLGAPALETALMANKPPTDSSGALPAGWTRVNFISEGLVVRPAWSIPLYPLDWVNSVAHVPMKLDLAGSGAILARGKQQDLIAGPAVASLGISASAWGAISISPGSWFDSAIIATARLCDKPYRDPNLSNARVLGEGGMLPCRVAQFVVVLNPNFEMDFLSSALSTDQAADAPAHTVWTAGLCFSSAGQVAGSIPAAISVKPISETMTRVTAQANGQDRAFIIAVYVESMAT